MDNVDCRLLQFGFLWFLNGQASYQAVTSESLWALWGLLVLVQLWWLSAELSLRTTKPQVFRAEMVVHPLNRKVF